MCVENTTCDTEIQKVIPKIFEEKLNIKEISKNKTNFQTYSLFKSQLVVQIWTIIYVEYFINS